MMKHETGIRKLFAGLFAAATLAAIAMQGGVAQAAQDYSVWQSNYGSQLVAQDTGATVYPDPEFKYISIRRF